MPSISIQAQDDSDSCRISWISWVKREIETLHHPGRYLIKRRSPPQPLQQYTLNLFASPTVIGQGPITTLCDGHPRARFSTSFFTVSSHIKTDTILLFDIDRPPEKSNHPPPECSIHLDDCATQWQHFVTAFKNTTLDTQCLSGKTYCGVTKKKIEIFILTSEAAYASSSLFGGCSQLRHICSENKNDYLQLENTLNEVNDTTQSTNTTGVNPLFCDATSDHRSPYFVSCANIFERCDITVQRFQLIHFPNELISKDICANEGFGMARFRIHAKSGVTMTAKIQNITFRELSLDSGM